MKKFRNAIVAAALAALFAVPFVGGLDGTSVSAQAPAGVVSYAPVPGGEYKIDPAHSLIGFAVRHLEINWVEGRFKDFSGTINFDDKDVTKSSVEFSAKVASVDTEVEARDKHLRTADFFDAEKYPEMSFKSTGVERKGKDAYVLHGELTIKGVTKPVALPFTLTGAVKDPWGNTRFGVEAQTKINRRDFQINYGNAFAGGGLDVGNEVTIKLRLEAVQPAPKPAGQ
ncbi:MAG TPA: YceI family protein [Pyrinomonadaceae bacterium]|nr:YceI family protein [Pyrinomonadaceae bacterium]